jgi:hypothetical protein
MVVEQPQSTRVKEPTLLWNQVESSQNYMSGKATNQDLRLGQGDSAPGVCKLCFRHEVLPWACRAH